MISKEIIEYLAKRDRENKYNEKGYLMAESFLISKWELIQKFLYSNGLDIVIRGGFENIVNKNKIQKITRRK